MTLVGNVNNFNLKNHQVLNLKCPSINKTEQAVQSQRLRKLHYYINIGEQTDFLIFANCNQSCELKNSNKKINLGNAEQC